MSSPIAIPSKNTTSYAHDDAMSSVSSTSSTVYVPLHKRASSPDTETPQSSTYTRDFLLSLARSPLSRLDADKKAHIRTVFPEIAMNRKMRKSLEYHAAQHEKALKAAAAFSERERSSSPRRSQPQPQPQPHHNEHKEHKEHKQEAPTPAPVTAPAVNSPTYNPFSPLAPSSRRPNMRRTRSRTPLRAPERRRNMFASFGVKMQHKDLDSAVSWRGGVRVPMGPIAV